jgi:hypothetical protein
VEFGRNYGPTSLNKGQAMKIEKEIIFAAKIEEVRQLLEKHGFKNNQPLNENEGFLKVPSSGRAARKNNIPNEAFAREPGIEEPSSHISTIYDLAEYGSRTLLKITIHGWDKLNPEQAKVEMPRIALLLERELSRIKKKLETRRGL